MNLDKKYNVVIDELKEARVLRALELAYIAVGKVLLTAIVIAAAQWLINRPPVWAQEVQAFNIGLANITTLHVQLTRMPPDLASSSSPSKFPWIIDIYSHSIDISYPNISVSIQQ